MYLFLRITAIAWPNSAVETSNTIHYRSQLKRNLERGESGRILVFCLQELKSYKHAKVHSGPERALADK